MTDSLLRPTYWLVHGLEWPQGTGPLREAAIAIAPATVPRARLSRDAADVLAVADAYHRMAGARVVFFSDTTLWLDRTGGSWETRGTDWETALAELAGEDSASLGLYLTISQRAHVVICDASRQGMTLHFADGRPPERITADERQLVHQVLERQLAADWPVYVQRMIDKGKIRTA